jgi:transcriptional antiterminator RfaH
MTETEPDTGITWYAVLCSPQMEFAADTNLRRQGLWTWLPFERVMRRRKLPNRDAFKVEKVQVPYFQGYLFAALRRPTESIYQINETDGVSTVIYQGDEPLPIPNDVMTELMSRADVSGCVGAVDRTARKRFPVGTKVRFVDESPLADFVATVSVDKGPAVRVFIEMLGKIREIPVPPSSIVAA